MHKTIKRVKNAIQPDGKIDFEMASLLRKGIEGKCGSVDGLKSDYVETYDSDPEDLIVKTSKKDRLARASRIFNVTEKSQLSSYIDSNKKLEADSPINNIMRDESPMNNGIIRIATGNVIEDHAEIRSQGEIGGKIHSNKVGIFLTPQKNIDH